MQVHGRSVFASAAFFLTLSRRQSFSREDLRTAKLIHKFVGHNANCALAEMVWRSMQLEGTGIALPQNNYMRFLFCLIFVSLS